jgi:hypothetical protein
MPGTYFAMRGSCAASGPTERSGRVFRKTEDTDTVHEVCSNWMAGMSDSMTTNAARGERRGKQ